MRGFGSGREHREHNSRGGGRGRTRHCSLGAAAEEHGRLLAAARANGNLSMLTVDEADISVHPCFPTARCAATAAAAGGRRSGLTRWSGWRWGRRATTSSCSSRWVGGGGRVFPGPVPSRMRDGGGCTAVHVGAVGSDLGKDGLCRCVSLSADQLPAPAATNPLQLALLGGAHGGGGGGGRNGEARAGRRERMRGCPCRSATSSTGRWG